MPRLRGVGFCVHFRGINQSVGNSITDRTFVENEIVNFSSFGFLAKFFEVEASEANQSVVAQIVSIAVVECIQAEKCLLDIICKSFGIGTFHRFDFSHDEPGAKRWRRWRDR